MDLDFDGTIPGCWFRGVPIFNVPMKNLKSLNLSDCTIDSDELIHLTKTSEKLETLKIDGVSRILSFFQYDCSDA